MSFGDFSLKGKIAVVTGAGSGINLSFAKFAAEQGARVIVADLRLSDEAEQFLKGRGAEAVIFTKCDVTKRTDLENLIKVSEKEYNDVPDVYIAGAGVFDPPWSNFWDDNEEDGYSQVDINLNHPLKLTRIAIRALLRKNKKGVILVVSSLAGYQGNFAAALYCATKHGVIGFVRSMEALDRLEGIKVVAVSPGLVWTPLWTEHPEKIKQYGYTREHAITPEEVAKAMIELVTDGKYGGGTSLEVSAAGTRVLGTWNLEPRSNEGSDIPQEVSEGSWAPILAMLKSERGSQA